MAGRLRQGFDLSEIVEEFTLLGQCANALWTTLPAAEAPTEADRQHFATIIQGSIVQVTELFYEHMQQDEQQEKRYLRLLQTISDDALRSPEAPLTLRLGEVLRVFIEATGATAASLLLYEPKTKKLLAAASTGLGNEQLEQFATTLGGVSLSDEIAAHAEPTFVDDVEFTELSVSDALRHSGIHALVGIRLPPRHQLVGVLYIGLKERRSFTAREVRRLEALGDRLTLHLDNANLYTALRRHIEELDVERELRERYVAILAHDLRGPLSTVKLVMHKLQTSPNWAHAEDGVRIVRNLDRVERMVRNMLDVSRVRAGEQLPLQLAPLDLGALAQEVVAEITALLGPRFELSLPGPVRGIWSREELRRAIWNLAENAVKYGSSETPVRIGVEQVAGGARAYVHNFGNPIAPSDYARLFDIFARLKSAARPNPGWGLGLTLVKACAEAHGGKVDVQSSAEAGTTFSIELPLDSRPFQTEVAAAPAPAASAAKS